MTTSGGRSSAGRRSGTAKGSVARSGTVKWWRASLLILALALSDLRPVTAQGEFIEQAKLVGSGAPYALPQGFSVSSSSDGSTICVGGGRAGGAFGNTSIAWVFSRASNGTWEEQFVWDTPVNHSDLRVSVAMSASGDTCAVGAWSDTTNDTSDIPVAIFTRSGQTWSQSSSLVGTNATGGFQSTGLAVSGDGRTVASGYSFDGDYGATWAFGLSGQGWVQQGQKLIGRSDHVYAYAGQSVALSYSGDILVVGGQSGDVVGAMWIFTRSAAGEWSQQADPVYGSRTARAVPAGASLSMSSDASIIAMGGLNSDTNVGAAWVFRRVDASTWLQQGDPLAPAAGAGTFGGSVALDGNATKLVVGAYTDSNQLGAAYVFLPPASADGNWTQVDKLVGSNPLGSRNWFGSSCSLSADGSTLASAGRADNDGIGATWVFTWTGVPQLLPPMIANAPEVALPGMPAPRSSKACTTGCVVGIAVGGVLLLVMASLAVALFLWRKNRRSTTGGIDRQRAAILQRSVNGRRRTGAVVNQGLMHSGGPELTLASLTTCTVPTIVTTVPDDAPALEVLRLQLDALAASNTLLCDRYRLGQRSERRVGGQSVVQFASHAYNPTEVYALKFYLDVNVFDAEAAHYCNKSLHHVLPAVDNIVPGNSIRVIGRPLPPMVVMQKGESLDEWQRRRQADFASAMQIVLHITQRVVDIHDAGIVHRDLKPANLILYPARNAWTIIDFGVSVKTGSDAPLTCTLAYAAPETVLALVRGEKRARADTAVDVWALGVIAWELLTQTRVFSGVGLKDAVTETAEGRRPLPWEDTSDPTHDSNMRRLGFMRDGVMGMLCRDPAGRAKLSDTLRTWRSTLQHETTVTSPNSAPMPAEPSNTLPGLSSCAASSQLLP